LRRVRMSETSAAMTFVAFPIPSNTKALQTRLHVKADAVPCRTKRRTTS
jgi:hypothetical protein